MNVTVNSAVIALHGWLREHPPSWSSVRLSKLVNLRGEKANPAIDGHLPFVGMDDIDTGGLSIRNIRPFHQMKSSANRFEAGDVLYGRLRPYLNKTAVASSPGACSGELLVIVPSQAIAARYLQFFMHSRHFINCAMSTTTGDRPRVDFNAIGSFEIPLPPIAEQCRIIAWIDALFEEIAEGERALDSARKGLETYRRALLKAAVTGELTADWRNAAIPEVTGADVLNRIRAAPRGQAGSRGRRRRTLSENIIDPTALPLLPDEWTWARLGEIGELVGGVTVDAKRRPSDPVTVPYLRVANVQRGRIDLTIVKFLTLEKSVAEKLELQAGDVLLNEGGDRDKIGRGWVWEGQVPATVHQNHVFRVRLHDKGLSPFFVSHYTNEMGRSYFIEKGKQTTNLASISMTKVSEIPVPIPPPEECEEILRRVADGLSAASDTQHVLDAEASDVQRLRQSVLKAAFEGRLVSQDESDEPATVMLERIAALQAETRRPRRGWPRAVTL